MTEYIAAGGNKHPTAADWYHNILAYGTDRNIALWNPQVCKHLLIFMNEG